MSSANYLIENLEHRHEFPDFREGSIGHNAAWVLVERIKELERGVRMARFELDQVQIDGKASQLAAAITDADKQLDELDVRAFE